MSHSWSPYDLILGLLQEAFRRLREGLPLIPLASYRFLESREELYDQTGIGDKTEIEFFNGPHTIHGVGTFEFLRRHLTWPGSTQAG